MCMRVACVIFLTVSVFTYAQTYQPLIVVLPFGGSVEDSTARADSEMIRVIVEETIAKETRFVPVHPNKTLEYLKSHDISIERLESMRNIGFLRNGGADFFISINIKEDKKNYLLTLRFYDTPKGFSYTSQTLKFAKNARAIKRAAERLAHEFIFSRQVLDSFIDGMPRMLPRYAVGDIGPAGGIIFLVKPNNSDGWQFLEAAPQDIPIIVNWGNATESGWYPNGEGTETYTGSGKANTLLLTGASLITETKRRNAAELCRAYIQGGYNDWFLPSRDELNLLYQMLAKEGKGSFKGRSYWSSTQSGANTAWFQRFEDGRVYNDGQKTLLLSVRPVRMF